MADPVIYGPAFSTFTRSLRLTLEEKGVPYRLEEINIMEGAHQAPEHLARHPFAKVPAFEHNDFKLYETAAILTYIDEAFEGPSLRPAEPREKARMAQVLSIISSYAHSACIRSCFTQRVIMPMLGENPDEDVIAEALPEATTSINALEAIIGSQKFLAGDKISLADLFVAPVYDYFSQIPEGKKALAGAPNLRRWWDAISQRDSVVKTKPVLG
ncbi:MAG: glutathione S-transferase family protein [Amylibacter sp.]